MNTIFSRLQTIQARARQAAITAGRTPEDVLLLAVTKTHPAGVVLAAIAAGQRHFGENYVQEGVEKIQQVAADAVVGNAEITWHFIGPLQSNKTRLVAENFQWVHTVDRLKIAQRLSEQRPAHLPDLQVCVQVNISGESSKSGCLPSEAYELCSEVAALPRLRLRGLMAIPAPADDFESQRQPLAELRHLLSKLQVRGLVLDTLSMGMSHDLEAAVMEGSTLIRIGTAIFGVRETS